MNSQKYKKQLQAAQFAAEIFQETAEDVIKRQLSIAKTYYTRRSGALISNLSSRPFNVSKSVAGAKLIIRYVHHIRLLDLKKTASGKRKKVYHPIYNKPLYGYIYSYAYARLRYGISQSIKDNIGAALADATESPIKVTL